MISLKKNFISYSLLTVLNVLFPVVIFSYTSKILGPQIIGKGQFILSWCQYFALIAALGIPFYGTREVARIKQDKVLLSKLVSEIMVIHFFLSIIFFFVFIASIAFIPKFQDNKVAYIICSSLIFTGFFSIDWFFVGIENFKTITYRTFLVKVICVILIFTLVKTTDDFLFYLSIVTLSTVGNNLLNLLLLYKKVKIIFAGLNLKKHIKPLLFISSTSLAISLYQNFDTIILGLLSAQKYADNNVGLYTAAVKINKLFLPFITLLGTLFLPKISVLIHNKKIDEFVELTSKSFNFIISASVPFSFMIFFYSKELIQLFSGNAFLEASSASKILAGLSIVIGLSNLYGLQVLTSGQKDKQVFISVVGGALASVALNFILIPKLGVLGAAVSNIVCETMVMLMAFYYANYYYNIKFNFSLFFKTAFVCASLAPTFFIVTAFNLNPIISLITGCSAFSIFYILVQIFIMKNLIFLSAKNSIHNYMKHFF